MGTVPRLYNRLTSAVADTMVSLNDYVRGEPAAQAEQTTAGIATELTILVVDDAPINIAILDKALTREGYRVLTACSGPQARELAITHQPDLIILDVMMPEEDGFDVMRQPWHTLHGAAINIGARAVSEVARSIEHAIRHREMGTVPRLYNRLTSAVADTMVSLNDYVRGEPAAQAEQTTAGIATELTILVVDDAPINIAILDKALTREGYHRACYQAQRDGNGTPAL